MANFDSDDYPFATISYEVAYIQLLNRIEKNFITNLFKNERVFLNEDLREVLGFIDRIFKAKNLSGKDLFIYPDYAPIFSSYNYIFLYASFVETSRVGNTAVPVLRALERKIIRHHIHHYNIKYLQHIAVNTSYLDFCHSTLRSELGDPLVITKGLLAITSHFFDLFSEMANRTKYFCLS